MITPGNSRLANVAYNIDYIFPDELLMKDFKKVYIIQAGNMILNHKENNNLVILKKKKLSTSIYLIANSNNSNATFY